MPPRLVSLAILVYWCVAAFCLLTWEVLPELTLGYPPDFRAIASAGGTPKPVTWSIQIIDDPRSPDVRRQVGTAVTSSYRLEDGWFELGSRVNFDAQGLLKETPFHFTGSVRLELNSVYRVDRAGNLRSFDMKLKHAGSSETWATVNGRLKNGVMEVESKGPVQMLNQRLRFKYEPRSLVHDALGPLDRLPGLHVGQRWDTRMVNPFTGQVDTVRVEVQKRELVHWNSEPISAFVVLQRSGTITARTWVRPDGLIFRQEVPLPLVHLIMERMPEQAQTNPGEGAAL